MRKQINLLFFKTEGISKIKSAFRKNDLSVKCSIVLEDEGRHWYIVCYLNCSLDTGIYQIDCYPEAAQVFFDYTLDPEYLTEETMIDFMELEKLSSKNSYCPTARNILKCLPYLEGVYYIDSEFTFLDSYFESHLETPLKDAFHNRRQIPFEWFTKPGVHWPPTE